MLVLTEGIIQIAYRAIIAVTMAGLNCLGLWLPSKRFLAVESASNTKHALFAALTMFALSIAAYVAFLSVPRRHAM
jgi:hypothetical protein